jgi:succinate dehydrogenase / fumarate reductase iron-sulfur subunit
MNVNLWDLTDQIQALIRSRLRVDRDRLVDPDTPLAEFAPPREAGQAMSEYTLRLRLYDPVSGQEAYWEQFVVELDGHRSVLDAILKRRAERDGTIGIRCSCRAAICGSCGVRINGKPGLACHTHLARAAAAGREGSGVIVVEPMGNMPVIKDLIVDMDAVHRKKIERVTPWLINTQPIPEREYLVSRESMLDITQSMACIQCGACVSDCLSLEVDPLFIGPAPLAKAYRFVGDPRDAEHEERLRDLAADPHGIYDCTHCWMCIDACPKGVAPMSQIDDRNNGHRHELAFRNNIVRNGLLQESDLLADSYGGKLHPRTIPVLVASLPVILRALLRRKITLRSMRWHPHRRHFRDLRGLLDPIERRAERRELNLYVSGYDGEGPAQAAGSGPAMVATGTSPTRAAKPDPAAGEER